MATRRAFMGGQLPLDVGLHEALILWQAWTGRCSEVSKETIHRKAHLCLGPNCFPLLFGQTVDLECLHCQTFA